MIKVLEICLIFMYINSYDCNPDAKRLYDDLLSSYNRLIRPVFNNSDKLTVKMGLKLSQLIDVNLKNQIMTTNVWVNQEWMDHKLKWDPEEYGGVSQLYVPAEQIWLPDIVLYNNADGNYEVTIMTKAIIHDSGKVVWNPPAIYKSSCMIDINYFPFDQQECIMKFGSWSYDGNQVDLKHLFDPKETVNETVVELGIDLSEFYLNVEWDIMTVPAMKRIKYYSCCPEPYPDITFYITLRRKTLFYTVNLIIPCVGISCLSVLVFYLPSDSGEKVTLSVSIMLSLTFFFLVLIEIIPSTSLTMPLLGKYLVFTMVLVTCSVIVTILVLNIHFRSPSTHRMAPWVRKTFIHVMPKLLLMRPPQYRLESTDSDVKSKNGKAVTDVTNLLGPASCSNCAPIPIKSDQYVIKDFKCTKIRGLVPQSATLFPTSGSGEELIIQDMDTSPVLPLFESQTNFYPKEVDQVIRNAIFIAHHIDNADEFKSIQEDWKYVAMVLDRLFLWIFTLACLVGTLSILLWAPAIYDTSSPIDIIHSKIAKSQFEFLTNFDE